MKELERARQVLAAYLVGRRVSREEFAAAYAYLNEHDPAGLKRLSRDLRTGLGSEYDDECAAVCENMDAIVAMPFAEVEQLMPTFAKHLKLCPDCSDFMHRLKDTWLEAATEAVVGMYRRAAESIRITLDEFDQLLDLGGLRPLKPEVVLASMAHEARPSDWVLTDDKTGYVIKLAIKARPPHAAQLVCEVEHPPAPESEASSVELELVEAQTNLVKTSGPLSFFREQPIVLSPGSWLIRISLVLPKGQQGWEIPIDFEPPASG